MKYHEFMYVWKIVGVKFGYNREIYVVHVTIFVKFMLLCSLFQPYWPSSGIKYMMFTNSKSIYILNLWDLTNCTSHSNYHHHHHPCCFLQGIDNYIPETNHISGPYSFAATLFLYEAYSESKHRFAVKNEVLRSLVSVAECG